jgi:endo-1,4-beta-mannosidase
VLFSCFGSCNKGDEGVKYIFEQYRSKSEFMDKTIFSDGQPFFSGCNYWASNAGTFMWRNWSPEAVERDFKQLSAHGVTVLRVFPLWPDFQILNEHSEFAQTFTEFRMGEAPLPDTETGRAAVDPVMLERFHELCRLAEKYDIKLIVGLITAIAFTVRAIVRRQRRKKQPA